MSIASISVTPGFLDEHGNTRFVCIWDQAGDARPHPSEQGPSPFDYGAEVRADEHLKPALAASRQLRVLPYEIERRSQLMAGSHGTHVARIAAGSRDMCREAKIAVVLMGRTEDDEDRPKSFYDSTRLVHAVDYSGGLACTAVTR